MNISNFIKNNAYLCVGTLGIAIIGYLGYRVIRWIIHRCSKTEKVDQVAKKVISLQNAEACPSLKSSIKLNPLIDVEALKDKKSKELSGDLTYQGCNSEEIRCENEKFELPRTLYHLFFIYFSLNSFFNNQNKCLIISSLWAITLGHEEDLNNPLDERFLEDFRSLEILFHKDICAYMKSLGIANPKNCTWTELNQIVDSLWKDFESFYNKKKYKFLNTETRIEQLYYQFGRFIYFPPIRKKSRQLILNALAEEWSLPRDIFLFYRCGNLKNDHFQKIENEKIEKHSLSFNNGLLSGIVFEGTPSGTCPLSYQLYYADVSLYGLKLSKRKLEKYFFYPEKIKSGLIPLLAKGEFCHPRLKVLIESENEIISGSQAQYDDIRMLGTIRPNDNSKIESADQYLRKIRNIFNNHIVLLSEFPTIN